MEIEVRPARAADAGAIAMLNRDVQSKHVATVPWLFKDEGLAPEVVEDLLARPETLMLVGQCGNDHAGYVYAEIRAFKETPLTFAYRAAHVHHISVAAGYRRSGVARRLMEAVDAAAMAQGIDRLTADVWAFNADAQSFFAECGLAPYMLRYWRQRS